MPKFIKFRATYDIIFFSKIKGNIGSEKHKHFFFGPMLLFLYCNIVWKCQNPLAKLWEYVIEQNVLDKVAMLIHESCSFPSCLL